MRTVLIGQQDHTIKNYKCKKCNTIQSTYDSDRVCICGGGFICPNCNQINMNGNIEWVLNEGENNNDR